jgi:hypothetical protein
MMKHFLGRILKFGPPMGDLFVSATGCFVMMRGFRMVATEKEGSETGSPLRVDGRSRKPLAGIDAALFLLVFVASEALLTIRAFGR